MKKTYFYKTCWCRNKIGKKILLDRHVVTKGSLHTSHSERCHKKLNWWWLICVVVNITLRSEDEMRDKHRMGWWQIKKFVVGEKFDLLFVAFHVMKIFRHDWSSSASEECLLSKFHVNDAGGMITEPKPTKMIISNHH